MGLGLFPLLVAGWSSNSSYASIGAIRGVAQTISYEVGLALILINFLIMQGSMAMENFGASGWSGLRSLAIAPACYLWVVRAVAETNRTPFDFAEGESELVSGFNIEYGRGGFALIFMAEYARILMLRGITVVILTGLYLTSLLGLCLTLGLAFWWVWVRTTLPRFRYDKLISLA